MDNLMEKKRRGTLPSDAHPFSLRPSERLHTTQQFSRVFDEGRTFAFSCLVFRYHQGEGPYSRLGMAVNRKTGNAVRRNRIRRFIREAFRSTKLQLPHACDIVVLPRRKARYDRPAVKRAFEKFARFVKDHATR